MATLNFDATLIPPSPGNLDDNPAPEYQLRPATQQEYIAACQQRKAYIESCRNTWKAAVAELNKQRTLVELARDAFSAAKALQQPRPPYVDILSEGGALDPELMQ